MFVLCFFSFIIYSSGSVVLVSLAFPAVCSVSDPDLYSIVSSAPSGSGH